MHTVEWITSKSTFPEISFRVRARESKLCHWLNYVCHPIAIRKFFSGNFIRNVRVRNVFGYNREKLFFLARLERGIEERLKFEPYLLPRARHMTWDMNSTGATALPLTFSRHVRRVFSSMTRMLTRRHGDAAGRGGRWAVARAAAFCRSGALSWRDRVDVRADRTSSRRVTPVAFPPHPRDRLLAAAVWNQAEKTHAHRSHVRAALSAHIADRFPFARRPWPSTIGALRAHFLPYHTCVSTTYTRAGITVLPSYPWGNQSLSLSPLFWSARRNIL